MLAYPELVTVGETMVLLDAVDEGPLRHVHQFEKRFAGAESNVAIGVSRLGHSVGWISQISEDELGDYILNSIRGEGIDTSKVIRTSKAMTGLYLKEKVREGETEVYYYRKNSAASLLTKEQIDWNYMKHAKVLHYTGITPFLSESCCNVIKAFADFGKKNNMITSFDPNLRMKLLQTVPNHKEILLELMKGVDIFMPGIAEAQYLFDTSDVDEMIDICFEHGVKQVVIKNGEIGVYYASQKESGFIKSIKLQRVVDPIGAGDGFAAGVLSGQLEGLSLKASVQKGAIIGALVVSTKGDIEGLPTKRRLEQFVNSNQDVIR